MIAEQISWSNVLLYAVVTLVLIILFLIVVYITTRLAGAGWFRSKKEFYDKHFRFGGRKDSHE